MNHSRDDHTLPSEPTVAFGYRPTPHDEPSLGSAPTMVGQGVPGTSLGQIDQYQLVRKLGGGGFGVVYLARDTVSGIDVALKTLHPLLKSNPEEMEALRAKFALVSRLSHPNIASALVLHPCQRVDVWDESVRRELRLVPGDFIMVMRYAPGITLSKWRRQFKDGIVPLESALEVGRQIAAALDYAHGERIVHRDIKPANVMVETITSSDRQIVGSSDRQGAGTADDGTKGPLDGATRIRVRILDFGLAAEIRSSMSRVSTETGDTSGTRPYMAPEQWLGKKQDGRTDQYALACVLYELLSGEPPFAGVFETGDPAIMMQAVKGESPDEIDGVPPAVNAALLKALAKNPKERFASCAEFVAALGGANLGRHASSVSDAQDAHRTNSARPEVSPHHVPDSAAQEAEILRRKLSLSRALKAISDADRADAEFTKFVSTAEDEMAIAEEACKIARFATAAESLDNVESALDELRKAHVAREAAARKAKEEAERRAWEEAERKAKEEAERKEREAAKREAHKKALGKVLLVVVALATIGIGIKSLMRFSLAAAIRRNQEHGKIQLWAGGPYWATRNIGADKPEDYGLYFWWGDTIGYRREGNTWVASDGLSRNFSFSDGNTPTSRKDDATLKREGWITSAVVLTPAYDAAHVHWGGGWRMPTKQELGDLSSKCDWTWMTMDGVDGYVVRGRGAYAGASIFLPAAGYGDGTSLYFAGSHGYYWSSVTDSDPSAYSWRLYFGSTHYTNNYCRYYGQTIRPVQRLAK